jgi:hypothetical protein
LVKRAFASELEKNKRAVSPENLQRKIKKIRGEISK